MSPPVRPLRLAAGAVLAALLSAATLVPVAFADDGPPPGAVAVPIETVASIALLNRGVAYDDGTLLTATATPSGGTALWSYPVTGAGTSSLALGARTLVQSSIAAPGAASHGFAVSGERQVVDDNDNGQHRVLVTDTAYVDPSAPTVTMALPRVVAGDQVQVSGPYVLVGRTAYVATSSTPIYTVPADSPIVTLASHRVIWSTDAGAVYAKDLMTSAAPVLLRTAGCGSGCARTLAAYGDELVSGRPAEGLSVTNLTGAHATVAGPAWPATSHDAVWLGDDVLLVGSDTGVAAFDVSTGVSTGVWTSVPFVPDVVIDGQLDGRTFAYVTAAGEAKVAPVTVGSETAPRLLGALDTGALAPGTTRRSHDWMPRFEFSRPVRYCGVDIYNSAGVKVASLTAGQTPMAACMPGVWFGTVGIDETDPALPDGIYTWRLKATTYDFGAPDDPGQTVVTDAGAQPTGSFRLRRTNTGASFLTAPADVATAGTSTATTVAWKGLGTFPSGVTSGGFDVEYRTVTISRGKRVYGTSVPLLSKTTRSSTSFKGTPGRTYEFRARSRDNFGFSGPWTAWIMSNTPLDDGASAVKYSKGWTSQRATGRWAGTHHFATSTNRTMSITQPNVSGYALVMTTCRTCGSVTVYVDGKRWRTISLYSSSTKNRREAYSLSFPKFSTHNVKLVTVSSKYRVRIDLDAVLVRH